MEADSVIEILLKKRGLKTKKAIEEFFHPTRPEDLKSPFDSRPAIRLIKSHIKKNHKIAVYGDYDVDGLCSTAILWETLYKNYKNVFPHIPHRESEGYGLSIKGIDHCLEQGAELIIAVDNGIVAHEQIKYCRDKKCDIIIIDHHEPDKKLPDANVILHSLDCCAAGLAWFFCRDFLKTPNSELLTLVAIATICDLVPLLNTNRSFVKHGLEELQNTKRVGLLALIQEANIKKMGVYEIGYMIGPRLNAMGRLEHAIDSLRLLCTHKLDQAAQLAKLLGETNKFRQDETKNAVDHALGMLDENNLPDLIVVSDTSYHQGIIGLIAGKLAEKYHRPSIAISIGETESKASCRSVAGFHITDYLRKLDKLLATVGGHAMAAGFTVSNENLPKLLKKLSNTKIDPKFLKKTQRVDAVVPLSTINYELITRLKAFEPYGLGNPTPIFKSTNLSISNIKSVGKDGKHLKFQVGDLSAIWFNVPSPSLDSREGLGVSYDLTYQIEEDTWNGQSKLQLLIKNVQPGS